MLPDWAPKARGREDQASLWFYPTLGFWPILLGGDAQPLGKTKRPGALGRIEPLVISGDRGDGDPSELAHGPVALRAHRCAKSRRDRTEGGSTRVERASPTGTCAAGPLASQSHGRSGAADIHLQSVIPVAISPPDAQQHAFCPLPLILPTLRLLRIFLSSFFLTPFSAHDGDDKRP